MNSFGRLLRFSIFGESHGVGVGAVVDGLPAGLSIDMEHMQRHLQRRRPGQGKLTTQRKEPDEVEILSGVRDGRATGAPVTVFFRNRDARSKHYADIAVKPRPGHADWPAHVRYGGHNDPRGGGHFSGRLTAAVVAAGCLATGVLRELGIDVAAHVQQVGDIAGPAGALDIAAIRSHVDTNPVRTGHDSLALRMTAQAEAARKDRDSIGAVVEFVAEGLPVGLGEPWADSLESHLAHLLFAIPAVKGVSFGAGFAAAAMRGSAHNDPWLPADGGLRPATNHAGGALGGLSTGAPLWGHVAVKPASSIFQPQQTVDLRTGEAATLTIKGRHDPLIAVRAVPVVEAAVAFVLADLVCCARAGAAGPR